MSNAIPEPAIVDHCVSLYKTSTRNVADATKQLREFHAEADDARNRINHSIARLMQGRPAGRYVFNSNRHPGTNLQIDWSGTAINLWVIHSAADPSPITLTLQQPAETTATAATTAIAANP